MKWVLITGGARRLGAAMAEHLASLGYGALVHYNRSEREAVALSDRINSNGGKCHIVQADLSNQLATETLIPNALEKTGGLFALINSASVFERDQALNFQPERALKHFQINVISPSLLCREFFRNVGEGVIINMLDQKLWNMDGDFFSYTISKAAFRAATESMAASFAPKVRVCGVAPGLILKSGNQTDESYKQAHADTLLGKGPSAADIAHAAQFVLESGWMTGQIINVDSGSNLIKSRYG